VEAPVQAEERAARQRWLALGLGAAVGLAWFLARGGAAVVPTGSLEWMLGGDPSIHLNGWLQFRIASWGWPLGAAPGFLYPVGGSVATTDSIPWLAVTAKLLSPALPDRFQYFGLYLLACFALQGALGARLTSLVTGRPALQALGAGIFAVSPVLFSRLGHTALCSHWAILLALDANLRPQRDRRHAARTMAVLAGVLLFLAGTHPYLACMVLPLVGAFLWTCASEGVVSARWAAAAGAIALACVVGPFLLFGYVAGPEPSATDGFGVYSADLLTLVNPGGRSRFLPAFPIGALQGGGFGYLGVGVGALLAAVCGAVAARRRLPERWRRVVPVAVVVLGWFVYSLSQHVTVAGRQVLDLELLYAPLARVTGSLRASGRFVWPLHYALVAAAVLGWVRWQRARPAVAAAGLAAVLALQVAETWTPSTIAEASTHHALQPAMDAGAWSPYRGYAHLALVPPRLGIPKTDRDEWLQANLGLVAYSLGATYNSGYTARTRWDRVGAAVGELEEELRAGRLRPGTVYAFDPPRPAQAGWRCGEVITLQVCVAGEGGGGASAANGAEPPN
jgi:hypothetical protein